MSINYDVYGHCVKCHKKLLHERTVDAEIKLLFNGDTRKMELELEDGTLLIITICENCQQNLVEKDYKYILKSVIRGWEVETDMLVASKKKQHSHWTKEKKKKYMDRYRKIKFKNHGEVNNNGSNNKTVHI